MSRPRICFVADSHIADSSAMITGPMVQTYLLGKELSKKSWDVHFVAYGNMPKTLSGLYEGMVVHWIPKRRYIPILNVFRILLTLVKIRPQVCYQRGRDILTGITSFYCLLFGAHFIFASAGEDGVDRGKFRIQVNRKKKTAWVKAMLHLEAFVNDLVCEFGMRTARSVFVQTSHQLLRLEKTWRRTGRIVRSVHPIPPVTVRTKPLKVLWIGSIKPVKRPELFVQLAEQCISCECEFWIVGQLIDRHYEWLAGPELIPPNTRYLGSVPFQKSAELIGQCHLLVNTTAAGFEGLPNSFVQAWLAGVLTLSLNSDPDSLISRFNLGLVSEHLDDHREFILGMTQDVNRWACESARVRDFAREHFSVDKPIQAIEQSLIDSP